MHGFAQDTQRLRPISSPFALTKNQCRVSQFYICRDLLYHADLQYNIMQWTDEEKGAKPSALTRGWGRPGRMQHLQLHTLQMFLCRHWFLHVCTHCTIHTAAFSCASGWWVVEATLHICCVMISPIRTCCLQIRGHSLPMIDGKVQSLNPPSISLTKRLTHYTHTLKRVPCIKSTNMK